MASSERTPLLAASPAASSGSTLSPSASLPTSPTPVRPQLYTPINSSADLILTEDDIAIQGMVLALLAELADRGYVVPPGLPTLPTDMPQEEADAEIAFLRTVFRVPRHRQALDRHLPDLTKAAVGGMMNGTANGGGGVGSGAETPPVAAGSILATNRPSAANGRKGGSTAPARPSPLSSQQIDTTVLTSPSALFLSALLSLLISLQREYHGSVEETDPGVDGELRMFKARRELGERLYAVVGGLLDSYLLTGDAKTNAPHRDDNDEDDDGDDALVTLLFHDFPLNYDSMDRATCCKSFPSSRRDRRRPMCLTSGNGEQALTPATACSPALDLLLMLSSAPLVEAEDLISHPVVLASTEYVWRNGLLPPPRAGLRALSWKEAFIRLDRFSVPR